MLVTISGVKNAAPPQCQECASFNGTFVLEFPADGCTADSETFTVCGTDAHIEGTIALENSGGVKFEVHLRRNGLGLAVFIKEHLPGCYEPQTLALKAGTVTECDYTDATVVVTQFGDWTMEEFALASCVPALAKSRPSPINQIGRASCRERV